RQSKRRQLSIPRYVQRQLAHELRRGASTGRATRPWTTAVRADPARNQVAEIPGPGDGALRWSGETSRLLQVGRRVEQSHHILATAHVDDGDRARPALHPCDGRQPHAQRMADYKSHDPVARYQHHLFARVPCHEGLECWDRPLGSIVKRLTTGRSRHRLAVSPALIELGIACGSLATRQSLPIAEAHLAAGSAGGGEEPLGSGSVSLSPQCRCSVACV